MTETWINNKDHSFPLCIIEIYFIVSYNTLDIINLQKNDKLIALETKGIAVSNIATKT